MVNATALSSMIAAGILGSSSTFSITDSNGLCIDLAGGNPFDFEPIILFTCHLDNEPLNQEWIFTLVSSPNVFSISNALQTASVMAFPATETGSTFQGLVARLDSSITWTLEPDSTFGPSAFNLIENVSGGAPTSSGDSELDIIIPQPRRTFPQFQDRRFEGFDEYVR